MTVSFTVKNTGSVAGLEVPQLYLTPPPSAGSPPRLLKGFDSVFIGSGESKLVTLQLSRYDFSIWDVVQQKWVIPPGSTGVSIGASSRDIKLTGSVTH